MSHFNFEWAALQNNRSLRFAWLTVVMSVGMATTMLGLPLRGVEPARAELMAGSTVRLEFPELPNTLAGLASRTTRNPVLSAHLPRNYSPDRPHPLFVYLKGYDGGRDDTADMARWMIGPDDFIAVSLPLFKTKLAADNRVTPIVGEDFEITSRAFETMLDKLDEAVPNIDRTRSCIGGHSNGAHALGVLLAGGDEPLLQRFQAYYLHEGGLAMFAPSVSLKPQLKNARFLVLLGEHSMGRVTPLREGMPVPINQIRQQITKESLNANVVTMVGYGHDVPPEYHRIIGQWARREAMDDVVAKQATLAASLSLPLRSHPNSSSWNDLLTPDLTNMKVTSSGWSFDGMVLTALDDKHLWTKASHGNCVLDLEFKLETGARCGLLLYNSDDKNWRQKSIVIQLCDDEDPLWRDKPSGWHCGAFLGRQGPSQRAAKPYGQWNRLTVTCQGPSICVLLNGQVVNEIELSRWTRPDQNPDGTEVPLDLQGDAWSKLPYQGRIGLEGCSTGTRAHFRNIKLLRL